MPNQFQLDRRDLLRTMGAGLLGATCARWLPAMAAELASDPRRTRHCILLWMSGGPSQTDTFDMKPGHANGGEFREIPTRAAGLRFCEHLPKLAEHAERLAVVRSLSTKEGDHARGAQLVRTGHPPMGEVAYPSIACSLAKQLEDRRSAEALVLPSYVSVAPYDQVSPAAFGPGFLGARYAPAVVGGSGAPGVRRGRGGGFAELRLENLEPPGDVDPRQAARRLELWTSLERRFLEQNQADSFAAHHALYRKATAMMRPEVQAAFDLSQEPDDVRRKYGAGQFGQGCLLARRLVERGVPFVEVALGDGLGWDTHADNFNQLKRLCGELDAGWATLMTELAERGLLDSTTILWMGEFGRTPQINPQAGRDHFPGAWSCVFGGGGIAGGQAYGRTSADGTTVEEDPAAIGDVLATLSTALGVPP
ncbi:MAG TPA: DUF1501 domain-containing protein, partial [Lacipirellulaceae bacterium]|nr:DUF1501 domain-containing protein [Lacipirellulaceae bacterium]